MPDAPLPTSPIRLALRLSRPLWIPATITVIAVVAATLLSGAAVPFLIKTTIDRLTELGPGAPLWDALKWAVALGGAWWIAFCLYRIAGFARAMVWLPRLRAEISRRLFARLLEHDAKFFEDRFAGALVTKVNAGADTSKLIGMIWGWITLPLTLAGALAAATTAHPLLAAIIAGWTAIATPAAFFLMKKRRKLAQAWTRAAVELRGQMTDAAVGIAAVRDTAAEDRELARTAEFIEKVRATSAANFRVTEWARVGIDAMVGIFVIGLIGAAIWLWHTGAGTIGDIAMIVGLSQRVQHHVRSFGDRFGDFLETYGTVEEGLREILTEPGSPDAPDARALRIGGGEISVKNLDFSYLPGTPVFEKLSLKIAPGEKVGIVGPSGAGKSTLVALLLRNRAPDRGAIAIDGQNISEVSQKSLRRAVATVPQEPVLFHRSIRENLAYGRPDATDEEIFTAARAARVAEFVENLPEKYDTLVGERGVKLSGGQRQRVAVGRAILRGAPILVLDEATSALDSESEAAVQDALRAAMTGRTVVAIAHRLSTLREMDRIFVLEKGKIVETGPPAELLKKTDGKFARLWARQSGGFLVEDAAEKTR